MLKRIALLLLLTGALSGCAGSFYRVAPEDFRARVKRLAVLPLLVDEGSTILHPQREAVVALLRQSAAGREESLAEQLRAQKSYAAVQTVASDPQRLAARLLKGSEVQSDKSGVFRQYRLDPAVAAEVAGKGGADGVLAIVLNGIEAKEKRWERSGLRFLESDYNFIQATALVFDAKGEILWERPGYIGGPFLDLQYANFDEAYHNRSDLVRIEFITVEGLERGLKAVDKTLFAPSELPTLYRQLFDAVAATLRGGSGR